MVSKSKPTKILFINHESQLYGATRSLLTLILVLKDTHHIEPTLLIPGEGPLFQVLKEHSIETMILKIPWHVEHINKEYRSHYYRFKEQALKLYRQLHFAVKVKRMIKGRNINLIYTNTSVVFTGYIVSKLTHLKHIWHIREFLEHDHSLRFALGRNMLLRLLKGNDYNIFISEYLYTYYQGHSRNASVVFNGIYTKQEFSENLTKGLQRRSNVKKTFVFVIIGTVSVNKGQHIAVRAISRLYEQDKTVRLVIVGKSKAGYVEELINQYKAFDCVEYWNHIEDPEQAYLYSDALLMCSASEAFGRVTVEAMSYGLPVIGFNNAGTKEIITHGKTGFLYNSETELLEYMMLLTKEKEVCFRIANEASNMIAKRFSIENYGNSVLSVIQKVI
jgi:glycosyltransferase involved in cell wall biosynthesis